MSRDTLHHLVDKIPETDILAAQRYLAYLASGPAMRAAYLAEPDDEPVTLEDEDAMTRARRDLRAGKVVRHDDILREFGLG